MAPLMRIYHKEPGMGVPWRQARGTLLANACKRAEQARQLRRIIDATDGPTVVAGDLNDMPSSYTYRTLRDVYKRQPHPLGHRRFDGRHERTPRGVEMCIRDRQFTVLNNGAGDILIGAGARVGIGSVVIGPVRMGERAGLGQHVFVAGFNHGYADATRDSNVCLLYTSRCV